jgi:hypothetical protein
VLGAAGFHFLSDGGELVGGEGFSGEGEDGGVFEVDVAFVELGEVGEALLEGGFVFGAELAGGEPCVAEGVDVVVPDVGAEVVSVEGVDAVEGVVDFVRGGLAEAGEEGFFFVEGVAGGGFLEVAEGDLEGAAGFVGEAAIGGDIDDAGEDGEEMFDAAVAVLEEVEGLFEVGLMGGAELDGHGGLLVVLLKA